VQEIMAACDKANIPVFLKNNLTPLLNPKRYETLILRQEMPSFDDAGRLLAARPAS